MDKPRVGMVVARSFGTGGIQTCCLELCGGLNRLGIVPDMIWDEPTDWGAFTEPIPQMRFAQARLPISSARLRSLPSWLMYLLRPLSRRFARLGLNRYDFVYSFEPLVRMPAALPNVCWVGGPPLVDLPDHMGDEYGRSTRGPLRTFAARHLTPYRRRPDPNARYVAPADWIAELCLKKHGLRVRSIWPPARTRTIVPASSRAGFLFFSRLYEGKRPHVLLDLARHLPKQKFTIAGAPAMANDPYVSALAASTRFQTPGNVRLTLDPSDSEISRLFAEHEFFVFPSRLEQFGIVTVEALQAGLLPLVHDSGGQREIVPIAALRFKSDMELAEKAAVLLATPPSERKDMLEALRRHVARGSPENFQREMILPMCQDLGLTHLMSQV